MLGDYADQRQRMEIERLRNMQAAGEAERRLRQAGMDIGYQDFLRQKPSRRSSWAFYSQMFEKRRSRRTDADIIWYATVHHATVAGNRIAAAGLYNAFRGRRDDEHS